ncbi:hypothetical protein Enr17x_56230 [Gimesia fumaroli]|jgi:hypothetical protein|uniref:Uncharacterized protein n=1 Tax=Gimesia fumaroli TaxID=2527976 RepID=A0A518IKC9_9PLAN|nr:hypothetical protein Enr17x_56230 [Gimesia fumaroli]
MRSQGLEICVKGDVFQDQCLIINSSENKERAQ